MRESTPSAQDRPQFWKDLTEVLQSAGDGILVYDPAGQVQFANQAAAELIGYSSPAALMAHGLAEAWGWLDIFDADGQPLPSGRAPGLRVLAGESDVSATIRYRIRRSGEERWSVVHSRAVQNRDGALQWVVTTFHDVTELKAAEAREAALNRELEARVAERTEQLAAQAAELREQANLLELAHDAIFVRDYHGNAIRYWNAGATRLYGWSREEALGQVTHTFLKSKFPGSLESLNRELVEMGHWEGEITHSRRDGSRFVVSSHQAVWRDEDGVPISILEINTDLTLQRQQEQDKLQLLAEQAARAQAEEGQARATFLAEASRELASSLDYATTLSAVANLAVPRFADWAAVDTLDDHGRVHRLAVAHTDPAKLALARELASHMPTESNAPRALRTGKAELYPEITDAMLEAGVADPESLRILRELGLRSGMVVPLVARGQILATITFAWAESERRYGPSDLAVAEELANMAALAVDNARLYRDSQREVESRDAFLASASHDLRNPLASIKAVAQLLQMQVAQTGSVDAERLKAAVMNIDATTTRMAAMIAGVLDLAQLQMGRALELDCRPTDLETLVRQVVLECQLTTQRHEISVRHAGSLIGEWDEPRLQRVVANLIQNAIKYSPEGGPITVTLARREAEYPLAILTVRDQGVGIPEDDLPQIFERFRRGSNVIGKIAGTGIGLAGAKQIVEQHGGTIEVESHEGAGTTVTVSLPLTGAVLEVESGEVKRI